MRESALMMVKVVVKLTGSRGQMKMKGELS